MLRTAFLLAILVTVASLAFATPMTVNYLECELGCSTPDQPGPYYSVRGGEVSNPNYYFAYGVTDSSQIESINSLTITFQVYRTASGTHTGSGILLPNSYNIPLAGFNAAGYGAASPETITYTVTDGTDLSDLLTIIDSHGGDFLFGIRVAAGNGNNYYIAAPPTITMDATLIPEPASFALIGVGLFAIAALCRKRLKR